MSDVPPTQKKRRRRWVGLLSLLIVVGFLARVTLPIENHSTRLMFLIEG